MFDVIVVGAGPAGLFASYELISKNPKLKVMLIDKGKKANERVCPMNQKGIPCVNCNPCNIMCGFGGAGTFSDGKLNFIPKIGKTDLCKYMTEEEANKIIDDSEEIFNKFGMDSEVYPTSSEEAEKIKNDISLTGAKLLVIKQKHLGSDKLPMYITKFTEYLENAGVTIVDKTDVLDVVKENDYNLVKTNKEEYKAKYVILAPGRSGAKWIQDFTSKNNIPFTSQSIEIGVRVEVRKEVLQNLTDIIYDPTIFIKTDTYSDEIRTFCTNPCGFVAKENYYGFICVNGHALKDVKSNNSNFAFITKIGLTEPATNTRAYGESIARIANILGDGKVILQTLKDLKRGRRSTWDRINKGFITPTLSDCVAGDLALVMPHRIITDILEGLEKLDNIIPGVNNDETLLYGPEIKFFSNEVETNNKFNINETNIYAIGDGCGKSGNIVSAAVTGLVAARDILSKE